MSTKKQTTAEAVCAIAQPVALEMGLLLWDVVFVKEGPSWFLRLFIDKDGGVTLEDCERFSRAIDPLIDALDPAEQEYFFEVSSPGLGRLLRTSAHLQAYIGKNIRIRLYRTDEKKEKEYSGVLLSFDTGSITLETPGEISSFARNMLSSIKADDDSDLFGGSK